MIYLYNYSGEPWKAQYHVRNIMQKLYSATPDGYCGDEDNGQTSAWYVFSALGFYPVCPGSDQYVLGSPLFDQVCLHLENGKDITIQAIDNAPSNCYVKELRADGKKVENTYLTHDQLMKGVDLQFKMSDTPNTKRGVKQKYAPYSFSLCKDK